MRSFFKMLFASLLALLIFGLLCVLFITLFLGGLTSGKSHRIVARSVLVIDLGQQYKEQVQENFLSILDKDGDKAIPGLYDVIRLLKKAKDDKRISGVYLIANKSPNGFAASTELRNALIDFKKSGKFVFAHGDMITQRAYAIANISDKIYLSPQGNFEWMGFSVEYVFLKGTLEKLQIEPQVFYAGKFKSATEPLRTDHMTDENKLQTTVWLNDLYSAFLESTSRSRKIDTATLHRLADDGRIQNAKDALDHQLVDGLKYNDEVENEIKTRIGIGASEKVHYVTIGAYMDAGGFVPQDGEEIALIYAEGDIVDGKAEIGVIASENYRDIIRRARLNKNVKAIVFRINSGGGSSIASENIWRELAIAKKEKPVIVSFGDVAASGGYYISCAADSIFAEPTTITGSIGVFGIIPNMEQFFKNKLGVSFDGVKTGQYADAGAPYRPMTEVEKKMVQAQIELTYTQFKQRVAEGRGKDISLVDSIAQGRVWTGIRAKEIGLIDRFGGIGEALEAAAKLAKLDKYHVREFPEKDNILDNLLRKSNPLFANDKLKSEIGEENYRILNEMRQVKNMCNTIQARLPFSFYIH